MIYRMIVLEVDGEAEDFTLDLRAVHSEGPPSVRSSTETLTLGGVRKIGDRWHTIGASETVSINNYETAESALTILLEAHRRDMARRLSP